jgi:hypothetical protein
MNSRSILLAGVGAAVTVVVTLFVASHARSQINASPALVPIGVSSSGNTSTVWFHEPHSRIAVACQTAAGQGPGLSSIQCVTTKLP